jgi:CubicO group peptidase (beta-lactamase class C family)
MASLLTRLGDLQDALDTLARRHKVPGATLAVARDQELLDFATGVVNADTGVETTPDSIFQIGSNTKLYTATLVMQLVDAGQVELDAPVRTYLKDFALRDATAAREITVRQLLTHTSGIQGDYFKGFGRGDDAIERYVASLADIDLVHRPGEMWSYCNSGFVAAGRLAEVVTGKPYHQLLAERICAPLRLSSTTIRVEEMVAKRCAVGHVPGPGGKPMVPPMVVMEYAQAPAGSLTTSTAAELVRFAQMHLRGGAGPDGGQVLSAESTRAMQEPQLSLPPGGGIDQRMGIGWIMDTWGGKRVIGHNGGTIGQLSFLQCFPDESLVVALLTNSATGGLMWRDLARWLFDELAGVSLPEPPKPADPPPALDLSKYAGTYERYGVRAVVTVDGDSLSMQQELTDELSEMQQGQPPAPPVKLRPIDKERFALKMGGVDGVVAFLGFQGTRPGYLFVGRAARRTGEAPRSPGTKATVKKTSAAKKGSAKKTAAKRSPATKSAAKKSGARKRARK